MEVSLLSAKVSKEPMQAVTSPDKLELLPAEELLRWAVSTWGRQFGVLTSFQSEGMVIVDMAVKIAPDVRVLTLDTGRLSEDTYEMMERVRRQYGINVHVLQPDSDETSRMVTRFGPNLFRDSTAHRRLCCEIRKVRPFNKALETLQAWAVGVRRGQNDSRAAIRKVTPERGGRTKISPLADWTREQITAYTREHNVPVHPLYEKGFTSIGCAPCTRATKPGEAERAGRWWWETDGNSECGLHFTAEGRVERTVDVLLREILTA